MGRFLTVCSVLGVLAACAGPSTAPKGPECVKASFCPGCGCFCDERCPMDDAGICNACGRKPMTVDACERTWYGCKVHGTWHDATCGDHAAKNCCTPAKGLTLCVKPTGEAKYCPGCLAFCGTEACPSDEKGNCKRCGLAPIVVGVADITRHWCATHKEWHEVPCSENATKGCCQEAKARVMACGAPK